MIGTVLAGDIFLPRFFFPGPRKRFAKVLRHLLYEQTKCVALQLAAHSHDA